MNISRYERSFIETQRQILTFFNPTIPLENQPKYIVNIGCEDGVFLKQIYNFISKHTLRGKHLKDFPLILIGVDNHESALNETQKKLNNIPHRLLKGDIKEPENIMLNLSSLGINDPENILHVCSYGNHQFYHPSFLSEENRSITTKITSSISTHLNSLKKSFSLAELIAEWRAYLQKWGEILQEPPHSLFILEVHSLNAEMTKKIFSESERLHFDTLYQFSEHSLLDAETFIILAANFKVFNHNQAPETPSFCRLIFNYLGEMDYQVCNAQLDDLSELLNLEEQCWSKETRMSKSVLENRLINYREGQYVLKLEGKVVGVVYSQRILNQEDLLNENAMNIAHLHCVDGPVVQLLALNIDPKVQERRLGDQLLEFMLQRCEMIPEIQSVVGVTLCRDFYKHKNMEMANYIHQRDDRGRILDPILRFHELHGASILVPVPGYRPKDNNFVGIKSFPFPPYRFIS